MDGEIGGSRNKEENFDQDKHCYGFCNSKWHNLECFYLLRFDCPFSNYQCNRSYSDFLY